MPKPSHVLIVGGGLAGPSLALCLARHRIRSTIFERRPHPGQTGGSITLAANALRALDQYVGVYPDIQRAGYLHQGFQAYLADGYRLGEIGLSDGGYPAIRIMRGAVHRILMDKCKEQGEWIKWESGRNVVEVHEGSEGVEVELQDGQRFFGDILVGADGVNSLVRTHVLSSLGRPNPTPEYIGTCIVVSYVPRILVDLPGNLKFPYMFFCPSGQVQITCTDPAPSPSDRAQGDGTRTHEGDLSLVITRKFPPRSPEAWKTLASSGEAARLAIADYAEATVEPLRSALRHVDPKNSEVWAPYAIPDIGNKWSTERVVLIGDAAHALPPNGQGTAMAFEDSAFLARVLTESPSTSSVGAAPGEGDGEGEGYEKLFEHFTTIRRRRIDGLREKNLPTVISWIKDSIIPGPVMWYLKSWVFWAFFYFQGGTVHMKGIHDYDVSKERAMAE